MKVTRKVSATIELDDTELSMLLDVLFFAETMARENRRDSYNQGRFDESNHYHEQAERTRHILNLLTDK